MMRRLLPPSLAPSLAPPLALPLILPLIALLLFGATAPANPRSSPPPPPPLPSETMAPSIAAARAEAVAADRRLATLEAASASAGDDIARLHAQQATAAAAIDVSEARIAEAGVQLIAARAGVAAADAALARSRAPQAALLAGMATMARRPPILALLSPGGGIAEMVRVRALLAATTPTIRARSARLADDLRRRQAMAVEASQLEGTLADRRDDLAAQRQQFAELEASARSRMAALSGAVLGAGDQLLASGESLALLGNAAAAEAASRRAAAAIAATPFAPPRPYRPSEVAPRPLDYRLPVAAAIDQGLGAVDANGIASRGDRFLTRRNAAVIAPAAGRVVFAGAYRQHDGLIIIDHGDGWTSVLIDVAPSVKKGDAIVAGAPIGRALGPVGVELRHRGTVESPSLIAGSSAALSNDGKSG